MAARDLDESSSLVSLGPSWGSNIYRLYVLLMLSLAYVTNQLDRFLISQCTVAMATNIGYGDQTCTYNSSYLKSELNYTDCSHTQQARSVSEFSKSYLQNGQKTYDECHLSH